MSPKSKVQSPKSDKFWTALAERSDDSALPRDPKRRRASLAAAVQMAPAVTNDIRDIKPPVEIPSGWEWLWWTLGVLAIAAIVFALWKWWRKRRSQIPLEPPVPAHVRAKQKLQEALALIAQPKQFCILVSDTIRNYLEERFDFRAPERTTEEFLRELGGTDLLLPEQKNSLGSFLASCDLVKFAKYEPREPELRELHAAAVRLVDETIPTAQDVSVSQVNTETQHTPESVTFNVPSSQPIKSEKGKILAIVGTAFQVAPVGWFFAYLAMIIHGSWSLLRNPTFGIEQIISIYKSAIVVVAICLTIGFVGLLLLFLALTSYRYRSEWFFWFLLFYGFMLFGIFPVIGIIIGLFFIIYCLTKRREFLNRT